jgi:hypothetical protein
MSSDNSYQLLLHIKKSFTWMSDTYQKDYLNDSDLQDINEWLDKINKGTCKINNIKTINLLLTLVNKIILWCDCCGNFTIDELRGQHEFIECIEYLSHCLNKFKQQNIKNSTSLKYIT